MNAILSLLHRAACMVALGVPGIAIGSTTYLGTPRPSDTLGHTIL